MITIINYGMGNLGSMVNMLKQIGIKTEIQSDPTLIESAQKIILPGVGAFDAAMNHINNMPHMREVLEKKVISEKVPILGVCLGMQLFTRGSEEGNQIGFGWISADTKRFPSLDGIKVPHMGWNNAYVNTPSPLTAGIDEEPRYYFVHSYYVDVDDKKYSSMRTTHGIEFDSAIGYENIYGVQFHPEKSHRFGIQILKNFAEL